jgi:glycerophosphoryl diester phosphodiesterase
MHRRNYLILSVLLWLACSSTTNQRLLPALELQGHRGARGLAPENTWPAFEQGIREGMTVLELDTVLTRDNDLIIHHDTMTNPGHCLSGDGSPISSQPIRTLTVAELTTLDCGSLPDPKFPEQKRYAKTPLLTLSGFFGKIKALEKIDVSVREITFNIEAKFPEGEIPTATELQNFAKIMLNTIRSANMLPRVTIQSFEIAFLPTIKNLEPQLRTSALFQPTKFQGLKIYLGLGSGVRNDILEAATRARANVISPYKLYVNSSFVADAHRLNLAVIPWTVNDDAEMTELLNLGVDGIITDYPNHLKKVVKVYEAK